MKRDRRVKVIATLGPASDSAEVIAKLFECGADVFRINMSHTPHDELKRLHGVIRGVEAEVGRPICILVDLQGTKAADRRICEWKDRVGPGAPNSVWTGMKPLEISRGFTCHILKYSNPLRPVTVCC